MNTAEFLEQAVEVARSYLKTTKIPAPEGTEFEGYKDPRFRSPVIAIKAPHNGEVMTNGARLSRTVELNEKNAIRFGMTSADALVFGVYEKLRLEKKNA